MADCRALAGLEGVENSDAIGLGNQVADVRLGAQRDAVSVVNDIRKAPAQAGTIRIHGYRNAPPWILFIISPAVSSAGPARPANT